MSIWKEYHLNLEHQKRIMQEAEHEKLVQLMKRNRQPGQIYGPYRLYSPVLLRVGRTLSHWGNVLQTRYGAININADDYLNSELEKILRNAIAQGSERTIAT